MRAIRGAFLAAVALLILSHGAPASPSRLSLSVNRLGNRLMRAAAYIWPFSQQADKYREALPWNVELTPSGEIFAHYVSGWLLCPERQSSDRFSSGMWAATRRAFDDGAATFEQRAMVAYWRPYKRRRCAVLDELVANPQLKESLSPEWAVVMWQFASWCAMIGGSTPEERAARKRYQELGDECLSGAAKRDPDWALPQLFLLEKHVDEALGRAAGGHSWSLDSTLTIDPGGRANNFPYVTEEDAEEIHRLTRTFNDAQDLRRLLPPPWLQRVSLHNLPPIIAESRRLRDHISRLPRAESVPSDQPRLLAAKFIAWDGGKRKNPEGIADAFRFVRKQLDMDPTWFGHPGFLIYFIEGVIESSNSWIANEEKLEALKALLDRASSRLKPVYRIYTRGFRSAERHEDTTETATEWWERNEDSVRKDFRDTLDQAIAIVLTLTPEDFRKK